MKYRLLAPGPTPVPDRVLRAMSGTIIHHRTDQFERIFHECKRGLKWLLDTTEPALILTASGTGACEASLQNFFGPNDTVLCVTGGKFGDNWYEMSRRFGLSAIEIKVPWGEAVTVEQVACALKEYPSAAGVIVVASETSTGVKHPFREIGQLLKEKGNCLYVVDGVTAIGVFDIAPEQDHIDVLVGGSQKGLMLPPGLSFLWASERAWQRSSQSHLPKFYFDLSKERKAQGKNQTGHTPAVSLIIGLMESLAMMKEEGKDNIFSRHARLAQATREGVKALNLKLFTNTPSEAITSVFSPPELAPNAVYDGLMNYANFTIAGGQEQLAGKIFRIGHMGYVDDIDVISVMGTLEIVLKKLGFEQFSMGASLEAMAPFLEAGFRLA